MISLMNRVSVIGLALFVLPLFVFAQDGSAEKLEALRALTLSLLGLMLAVAAASSVIRMRHIERLKR
jgi:hypothetical protein